MHAKRGANCIVGDKTNKHKKKDHKDQKEIFIPIHNISQGAMSILRHPTKTFT